MNRLTLLSILIFCNLLANRVVAQKADSAMYYFAAHQDDWQLFMSANAFNDVVISKFHTVFITLTAGDAGNGMDKFGTGFIPYYEARENGAILSAKFLADVNSAGQALKREAVTINGHKMYKYVYKNVVCYFMMLPNAHGDGKGYVKTGNQTLKMLHDKSIATLQTIDSAVTYKGWDDLTATLSKIVNTEKGDAKAGWINVPDTNQTLNKGDHSEHIQTSYAAQDAVANIKWLGVRQYLDYYTSHTQPNLANQQIENAAALHACDVVGMINGGYESNWNSEHKAWLPMDYFRVTRWPK
jgi:hypothetical protein